MEARDAAASAQVDVEATLAWRDFMVSDYSDAAQARWLADHGIDLLRGSWPARRAGRRRGGRRAAHRRAHRARQRGRPGSAAGAGPARARRRLDEPRGDLHEGRSAPSARSWAAGRWASRWRRPFGGSAARRRSSRWASTCSRVSRRHSARRSARLSAARASSSPCLRTQPPRGATARSSCSGSTTGESCAATGCWSPPAGARG